MDAPSEGRWGHASPGRGVRWLGALRMWRCLLGVLLIIPGVCPGPRYSSRIVETESGQIRGVSLSGVNSLLLTNLSLYTLSYKILLGKTTSNINKGGLFSKVFICSLKYVLLGLPQQTNKLAIQITFTFETQKVKLRCKETINLVEIYNT